ncbi:hypothetical protein M2323_001442 [Rhodoblastus acidophilus]|uniref:helix-turn-helix domain-containing protein n=1 Tax=Rhodoblastus acidophilus TaxID=1074 RepID=UPI002225A945|nr:helix-turn-helix domain-containing protein [Rhodoblastus acidophilus]MCW2283670.1 hypothetical protein [Rhodoblastus acidophilus]MCW2332530.1 hypothetical protein [Rhodoblastus acidophilus]
MTDSQPKRIKAKAAAEMLGVTPRTVQALAGKGALPGAAKIGGLWTFDPKKLTKFIADKEAEIAARAEWELRPPAWKTSHFQPRSSPTKSAQSFDRAMEILRNGGKWSRESGREKGPR